MSSVPVLLQAVSDLLPDHPGLVAVLLPCLAWAVGPSFALAVLAGQV